MRLRDLFYPWHRFKDVVLRRLAENTADIMELGAKLEGEVRSSERVHDSLIGRINALELDLTEHLDDD